MDVAPEVQAGIDAHRTRYEALKAAGIQVAAALPASPLDGAPVAPVAILHQEVVPGGWYARALLRRGDRLRLVNTDGVGAAALLAWALHDTSERLNHAGPGAGVSGRGSVERARMSRMILPGWRDRPCRGIVPGMKPV